MLSYLISDVWEAMRQEARPNGILRFAEPKSQHRADPAR
jgi:hypothetical protein